MNFYIQWVIFIENRNLKLYSRINANKLRLYSWQTYVVWRYVVLTKEADVLGPMNRHTLSNSHCSRVSVFFSLSCFHSFSWIFMYLCYSSGLATGTGQTKLKILNTICWNSCSHCSKTLLRCWI